MTTNEKALRLVTELNRVSTQIGDVSRRNGMVLHGMGLFLDHAHIRLCILREDVVRVLADRELDGTLRRLFISDLVPKCAKLHREVIDCRHQIAHAQMNLFFANRTDTPA